MLLGVTVQRNSNELRAKKQPARSTMEESRKEEQKKMGKNDKQTKNGKGVERGNRNAGSRSGAARRHLSSKGRCSEGDKEVYCTTPKKRPLPGQQEPNCQTESGTLREYISQQCTQCQEHKVASTRARHDIV
ncbi:hypothetical protein NDU88_001645 [Pleurodeles waltl]|uniref:Uncharacterized protein n=1 Tax=Pleurodeles waltl TaxID=8319 RepID=A0AAV7WMD7_PLEWA|nr:hypothetical protein NDU88_001645 [Pleurodeles waltl]